MDREHKGAVDGAVVWYMQLRKSLERNLDSDLRQSAVPKTVICFTCGSVTNLSCGHSTGAVIFGQRPPSKVKCIHFHHPCMHHTTSMKELDAAVQGCMCSLVPATVFPK